MNRYVHSGSDEFVIGRFEPISNKSMFPKPRGGLWASPIDAPFGWLDWCEENDFNTEHYMSCGFEFSLRDGSKVLDISVPEKVANLDPGYFVKRPSLEVEGLCFPETVYLDYERIAEDFDAILFELNGWSYYAFYGWDCDTLLVLNPDSVCDVSRYFTRL